METTTFSVATGREPVCVDITDRISDFIRELGDGLVSVFVPHATAGLAIIETGAGSDEDLLATVARLLPRQQRWQHRHGSTGHGADHVLPALLSPSLTVPVVAGHLTLGIWQSVVLVDTNADNPQREVRLSFLAG